MSGTHWGEDIFSDVDVFNGKSQFMDVDVYENDKNGCSEDEYYDTDEDDNLPLESVKNDGVDETHSWRKLAPDEHVPDFYFRESSQQEAATYVYYIDRNEPWRTYKQYMKRYHQEYSALTERMNSAFNKWKLWKPKRKRSVNQFELEKFLHAPEYPSPKFYIADGIKPDGSQYNHTSGMQCIKNDSTKLHSLIQQFGWRLLSWSDYEGFMLCQTFLLFLLTSKVRAKEMIAVALRYLTQDIIPGKAECEYPLNANPHNDVRAFKLGHYEELIHRFCAADGCNLDDSLITSKKKVTDLGIANTPATRAAETFCKVHNELLDNCPIKFSVVLNLSSQIVNIVLKMLETLMLSQKSNHVQKIQNHLINHWFPMDSDGDKARDQFKNNERRRIANAEKKAMKIKGNTVTAMPKELLIPSKFRTQYEPNVWAGLIEMNKLFKDIGYINEKEKKQNYRPNKLIYRTPSFMTDNDIKKPLVDRLTYVIDNFNAVCQYISPLHLRDQVTIVSDWDQAFMGMWGLPICKDGEMEVPFMFYGSEVLLRPHEHCYDHIIREAAPKYKRLIEKHYIPMLKETFPLLDLDTGYAMYNSHRDTKYKGSKNGVWYRLSELLRPISFYDLWMSRPDQGRYYIVYIDSDMKPCGPEYQDDEIFVKRERRRDAMEIMEDNEGLNPGMVYLLATDADPHIWGEGRLTEVKPDDYYVDFKQYPSLVKGGNGYFLDMHAFMQQTRTTAYLGLSLDGKYRGIILRNSFVPNERNRFTFKVKYFDIKEHIINKDGYQYDWVEFSPIYSQSINPAGSNSLYDDNNDDKEEYCEIMLQGGYDNIRSYPIPVKPIRLKSKGYVRDDTIEMKYWPFKDDITPRRIQVKDIQKVLKTPQALRHMSCYNDHSMTYIMSFNDDDMHVRIYHKDCPKLWIIPNSGERYRMPFTHVHGYNNPFSVPRPLPHIVNHYDYTLLKGTKKGKTIEEEVLDQEEKDNEDDAIMEMLEEEMRKLCPSFNSDLSERINKLVLADTSIYTQEGDNRCIKGKDSLMVDPSKRDPKDAVKEISFLFEDTREDKEQAEEKRLKKLGETIMKINNPCSRLARCINRSKGIKTSKSDEPLRKVLNECLKCSKKHLDDLKAEPKHKWTDKNSRDYHKLVRICEMIERYKKGIQQEIRDYKYKEKLGLINNDVDGNFHPPLKPTSSTTAVSFFDSIRTGFESNLPLLPGNKNKKKSRKKRCNGDNDDINDPKTKLEVALQKANEEVLKTTEKSNTGMGPKLSKKFQKAAGNTHQIEEYMVCIDKKKAGYHILNDKSSKKRLKTYHVDSSKNLKQSILPF